MDAGPSRVEASRNGMGRGPLPRSIIDEPGSELQGRTGPGEAVAPHQIGSTDRLVSLVSTTRPTAIIFMKNVAGIRS